MKNVKQGLNPSLLSAPRALPGCGGTRNGRGVGEQLVLEGEDLKGFWRSGAGTLVGTPVKTPQRDARGLGQPQQ